MINKIYEIVAQCSIYLAVLLAYVYCLFDMGVTFV